MSKLLGWSNLKTRPSVSCVLYSARATSQPSSPHMISSSSACLPRTPHVHGTCPAPLTDFMFKTSQKYEKAKAMVFTVKILCLWFAHVVKAFRMSSAAVAKEDEEGRANAIARLPAASPCAGLAPYRSPAHAFLQISPASLCCPFGTFQWICTHEF